MSVSAPRSPITTVPGWETLPEQELLLRLAQAVPDNGVIVELGAEYGMSASLFCHGARQTVEIVSIDLFPGDLLTQHRKNLYQAGFKPLTPNRFTRSEQVQGDSAALGRTWPQTGYGPIDLLFIDADHSYAGVKADIDAWIPHVRVGGRVCFHDCVDPANFHADHLAQFEVTRAVAEWFTAHAREWRTLDYVDSIMAFERTA